MNTNSGSLMLIVVKLSKKVNLYFFNRVLAFHLG